MMIFTAADVRQYPLRVDHRARVELEILVQQPGREGGRVRAEAAAQARERFDDQVEDVGALGGHGRPNTPAAGSPPAAKTPPPATINPGYININLFYPKNIVLGFYGWRCHDTVHRPAAGLDALFLEGALVPGFPTTIRAVADALAAPGHGILGIAFLSGGRSDVRATEHLNAMNRLGLSRPWPLTFSHGRALQQAALEHWRGIHARAEEAQRRLLLRARCNAAASTGSYEPAMETAAADAPA